MDTRDDTEIWRTFRDAGRAEGNPLPAGTPWAFATFDLMRAYPPIKATWISRDLVEQSVAYPESRRIVCPYPTDVLTGTAAMEEVFHVAKWDELKHLADWKRDEVVKGLVRDSIEAREDLAGEVKEAETILSRRYATHVDYALFRGAATIEDVRADCPDWLLAGYGLRASNGHVEVDEDELLGLLAGPRP